MSVVIIQKVYDNALAKVMATTTSVGYKNLDKFVLQTFNRQIYK